MDIAEIQLLFEYYYWATERLLNATAQVSQEQFTSPRADHQKSLRTTLVHILSSERNWRSRWQGGELQTDLQEQTFLTLESLRMYWKQQEQEMWVFLRTCQQENLLRSIAGTTNGGTPYVDLVWHSMMHVLFHGAQHRSEAAELLTAYGQSPEDLDFFVFLRHREQTGRRQQRGLKE